MTFLWIIGLVRHRLMRLLGAGFGIAVTVALLASLGTFLASSTATMTERATAAVPIDWQVEAVPGADATAIDAALRKAAPVAQVEQVFYAGTNGFQATTGGTVQTTGPGKVVGLGPQYLASFPKEVRLLSGVLNGVLVNEGTGAFPPDGNICLQSEGWPVYYRNVMVKELK